MPWESWRWRWRYLCDTTLSSPSTLICMAWENGISPVSLMHIWGQLQAYDFTFRPRRRIRLFWGGHLQIAFLFNYSYITASHTRNCMILLELVFRKASSNTIMILPVCDNPWTKDTLLICLKSPPDVPGYTWAWNHIGIWNIIEEAFWSSSLQAHHNVSDIRLGTM